ncbi:TonB-dependent receptor plug domain-containing protein [Desulfohalobium retbaense]|uniref:TonB-dependent receptor n=1 Tax=Desulfohalobium retbaense (strain ATCC 49708 / DSM 5692 / JCM 16813 / HR100) TaxID=485915 RepID=C8WZ55_DESRD|nr:TonB-dependent receptor [Desulfohalobium retbaense]ACV67330.1 TonB-dependent receptor [Desulfohalobium retbaense DSM 5692]
MRSVLAAALCVAVVCVGTSVGAQNATQLSEIVVTATAAPATEQDVPVSTQIVDREAIERSGARDLEGLLQREMAADFEIQPGGYSSFGIRGFESYESLGAGFDSGVLVLLDGTRIATGTLSLIPLDLVQRVEIVHGPGSALYGGSAMGGVVNVITRTGGQETAGQVGVGYGSWEEKTAHVGVSGCSSEETFGYVLAGSKRTRDDYAIGGGKTYPNTAIDMQSWGGKLTAGPGQQHQLHGVYLESRNNDLGSPGPLDDNVAENYIDDTLRHLLVTYQGESTDGKQSWRLQPFHSEHEYAFYSNDMSKYITQMAGVRGQYNHQTARLGTLSLGAEYTQIQDERSGSLVYEPNSEYDVTAVFAEHRFGSGPWDLWVGARYDHYRARIEKTSELKNVETGTETYDALTWRVGGKYWLTANLGLHAAVGTAFRPPMAKELTGKFTSYGTTYIGNPNLKSEHSVTYETGMEWGGQHGRIEGTVFHTKYTDKIEGPSFGETGKYVNIDGWTVQGLELQGQTAFDWSEMLIVRPHATARYYTKREQEDSGGSSQTIFQLPEYEGQIGLAVDLGAKLSLDSWLEIRGPWEGKNVGRQTEFAVFGSRISYRPVVDLQVYLDVENLFDKRYSYKNGYPMPGRSVAAGIEYTF